MSSKALGIEIINDLSTSGTLEFNDGYIFLGDDYEGDLNNEKDVLPPNSYAGTSESRGNVSRSLYDTSTSGPVIFGETGDDVNKIILKHPNIIATNPVLTAFPWLYPVSVQELFTANTQSSLDASSEFPIYKCLGKGLGEITFYKTGSSSPGNESSAGSTEIYNSNGLTCGLYQSQYQNGAVYPFDGSIYAGSLVQLVSETNVITGIKETKVIPYQQGRGIPQYATNFLPDDQTPLTPFSPFGEMTWPDSGNTISPSIAEGVEPGSSNSCIGIVLDTYSNVLPDNRAFQYQYPYGFTQEQLDDDNHDKWFDHPAPHSTPAVSFKTNLTTPATQGFLSPGPNAAGSYYSPWPRYYAYQANDPIPVLTKGITTARIGASYNIALMSYGIKRKISDTDESWVPISCIPLFEGERLEAGSFIYASVKGHMMSPGPYIDPVTIVEDDQPVGNIGQTPWDVFVDSTWGNIGWTGTPGLSFSTIPDQGVDVMEVLQDETGARRTLPYLNQSNQGSIIIHPISSVGPTPSLGNSYLQSQQELDIRAISEEQAAIIQAERYNLPGLSGRGMLSQTVPEKCQPIGIMMETIIGTGRWPYTPLTTPVVIPVTTITTGGVVYGTPAELGNTPLRDGTGAGAEGLWTTFLPDLPNLGTLTGTLTLPIPGVGYTDGDIVTFQDDSITYHTTPQYKANNASAVYETAGPSLTLQAGGSSYVDSTVSGFNLSLNNGYFNFDSAAGAIITTAVISINANYPQDYTRYSPGTVVYVLNDGTLRQDLGYTQIVDTFPTYTSVDWTVLSGGSGYPAGVLSYETNIINYKYADPELTITTTGGVIDTVVIENYGAGHKEGELILVLAGDFNAIFEFPAIPPGYQEILVSPIPNYESSLGPYTTVRASDGVDNGLIMDVITDPMVNDIFLPIVFLVNVLGAPVADTVYQLTYTGGFNIVPEPWYHSRRASVFHDNVGDIRPQQGGSSYTTGTGITTYNLTANMLRIQYTVTNNVITSHVTGLAPYDDDNFAILESRYTFNAVDGTEVRILDNNTPEDNQEISKLVSFDNSSIGSPGLTVSQVKAGGLYPDLADGDWIFQTQRTEQVNPMVDILAAADGHVTQIVLNTAGTGNQNGDLILVTQEGSDLNALFLYNNNMPLVNLPPYATPPPKYNIDTSSEAWERYADVMQSSVNLLDKQVLIELRSSNDQTMENITPYGVVGADEAPSTADVYKTYY